MKHVLKSISLLLAITLMTSLGFAETYNCNVTQSTGSWEDPVVVPLLENRKIEPRDLEDDGALVNALFWVRGEDGSGYLSALMLFRDKETGQKTFGFAQFPKEGGYSQNGSFTYFDDAQNLKVYGIGSAPSFRVTAECALITDSPEAEEVGPMATEASYTVERRNGSFFLKKR